MTHINPLEGFRMASDAEMVREEILEREWVKVCLSDFLLPHNEGRTRLCIAEWTTEAEPADHKLIWMEMHPTSASYDQYESRRRIGYADTFAHTSHVNWPYHVEWTEGNVAEWTAAELKTRVFRSYIDANFYLEVSEYIMKDSAYP